MKSILPYGLALASLLLATGCSDKGSATTDATTSTTPAQPASTDADGQGIKEKAAQYSCPMHPNEVSDHPGKCPKCGMALVKKS